MFHIQTKHGKQTLHNISEVLNYEYSDGKQSKPPALQFYWLSSTSHLFGVWKNRALTRCKWKHNIWWCSVSIKIAAVAILVQTKRYRVFTLKSWFTKVEFQTFNAPYTSGLHYYDAMSEILDFSLDIILIISREFVSCVIPRHAPNRQLLNHISRCLEPSD